MTQQLRALAAVAGDLGMIPSVHSRPTTSCNRRANEAYSGPRTVQSAKHLYKYINKINEKPKQTNTSKTTRWHTTPIPAKPQEATTRDLATSSRPAWSK